MTENNGFALGWDSPIEKESTFVLLEPGEYNFRVTKMERGQYQPSQQSSIREVSPKAEITLKVYDDSSENVSDNIMENLILHSKMEWKLSQFFISIGQKKTGEPLNPNWNAVIGSVGRCVIEVNEFKGRDGQDRKNNRVSEFLPPVAGYQAPQQPAYQQPVAQQQTQSFQPGATQQGTPTPPPANNGFSF